MPRILSACVVLLITTTSMSEASLLPLEGFLAARKLLQGAKPLQSQSDTHRRFVKLGDFKTALQDFYESDPRGVKIVRGGDKSLTMSGLVGDRELILTRYNYKENFFPVLEIRQPGASYDSAYTYNLLGDPYDRIVYKPSLD